MSGAVNSTHERRDARRTLFAGAGIAPAGGPSDEPSSLRHWISCSLGRARRRPRAADGEGVATRLHLGRVDEDRRPARLCRDSTGAPDALLSIGDRLTLQHGAEIVDFAGP